MGTGVWCRRGGGFAARPCNLLHERCICHTGRGGGTPCLTRKMLQKWNEAFDGYVISLMVGEIYK